MGLVVFTDLDGTLLDHATYGYEPARPAIACLKSKRIPLVLASSKTRAEIAVLHADLGLNHVPAIVENGAGVFRPGADQSDDRAYREIRQAVARLPDALSQHFKGFGDMDAAEVAGLTGLSAGAAQRAKVRCYSEPGLWSGGEDARRRFLEALAAEGIHGREGGRFLTLSHGRTKADAMADIAGELGATVTLALGDAPNDVEMLCAADIAVIVRNPASPGVPRLAGEDTGAITRTSLPGPEGWNAAVLQVVRSVSKT